MIWLIGGPARCGKSTLARQARELSKGQVASLDTMRHAFMAVASSENYEALNLAPKESDIPVAQWIETLRRRDRTLWQGAKAYLEAVDEYNEDVVLEGGLWPDFVAELQLEYRAVFLVDTSLSHVERLMDIARNHTEHNWMSDWDEPRLQRWAEYNVERSKTMKQLAKSHHQKVFDIADGGITQAQSRALSYLRNQEA